MRTSIELSSIFKQEPAMTDVFGWAGCGYCNSVFFSGGENPHSEEYRPSPNGVCAGREGANPHVAKQGWTYFALAQCLPGQIAAFFRCKKCESLFNWNAFGTLLHHPDAKGRCWGPAYPEGGGIGGGHLVTPRHEPDEAYQLPTFWNPYDHYREAKICSKCKAIFFAGDQSDNGACPDGGAHHADSPDYGVYFWRPG